MIENIEVLTHSSVRINSSRGIIYVDPFRIKDDNHDADYVFITHSHYDHFSIEDIRKIVKNTTILVVPYRMEDDAKELQREVADIVTVKPGIFKEFDEIEVKTIPAYNTVKPFHPKRAGWVGYIFKVDGKRIILQETQD